MNRVVITGMGVVTALGQDLETFWGNLTSGKSGISLIENFDVSEYPTRIAAEIKDFNIENYVDRKESRRMDRFVQFAVAGAINALKDANLNVKEDTDPERVGVSVGSGIGGLNTWEEQHRILVGKRTETRISFLYSDDDCEYGVWSSFDDYRGKRTELHGSYCLCNRHTLHW